MVDPNADPNRQDDAMHNRRQRSHLRPRSISARLFNRKVDSNGGLLHLVNMKQIRSLIGGSTTYRML